MEIASVTVGAARLLVAAADGIDVRAAAVSARLQLAASGAIVALATISAVHVASLIETTIRTLETNQIPLKNIIFAPICI